MKKTLLSIAASAALLGSAMPALAVGPAGGAQCVVEEREGRAASERVGRSIQRAFDLFDEEKIDEAIAILVDMSPRSDYDKAYVNRFIANLAAGQEGRQELAMERIALALDANILSNQDHGQLLRLQGDLAVQNEQYPEAMAAFQNWMDFTCDENDMVYLRMAVASSELKQFDDVIAYADAAMRVKGEPDRNIYLLKMGAYYEQKKFELAAGELEALLTHFPDNPKLWVQLGQLYLLAENNEKALYTMDIAFRNDLLDTGAELRLLGQLLLQRELPYASAIIQEFALERELIDREANVLSAIGSSFYQARETDKAIEYFGQAAEISNLSKDHRRKANLLVQQERYGEAKVALNKALKGDELENEGQIFLQLAQAHFYLDEFKEAKAAAEKAMREERLKRSVEGWLAYIEDVAKRRGIEM
ncbi:tetratricopeptide repeat protein [Ferrimonas pelagia]|uniref:Tetratricopeptide repeat protein n=2 Tax=Ferrimonas pelagia TaxID=1177826 RepID=A0ABP9EFX0_9GAMM